MSSGYVITDFQQGYATRRLEERDRENGVIPEYQRGAEGGSQDQQPDIPGGGQVQGLRGQQTGRLGGRGPGQSR